MDTPHPDTPTLVRRLDRHLDNAQRRALAAWAGEMLRIRRGDAPPLRKAKAALDTTYRAEVVVPVLRSAGGALADVAWKDRGWTGRLGIGGGALLLANAAGSQGLGVAALGGAIGVPLWMVLGGGDAFARELVDEMERSIRRHESGVRGTYPELEEAEFEVLPAPEAPLPVPAGRPPEDAAASEPLWRVFRRAYREARTRQRQGGG